MTLWDRIATVFSIGLFADERAAGALARRWNRTAGRDLQLTADLINLGGVLQLSDAASFTPDLRLAYDAGRRDLALQLLAASKLTVSELNMLLGDDHD